jgi:hypothetical protein
LNSDLQRLRDDRLITQKQYQRAALGTNPRVTSDKNLWVTLTNNRRVLIDPSGKVIFDGKQIVR